MSDKPVSESDTQALAARLARYAELDKKRTQGEWFDISGDVAALDANKRVASCGNQHAKPEKKDLINAAFIASAPAMASDLRLLQGVIEELVEILSSALPYTPDHIPRSAFNTIIALASPLVAKGGNDER
jgi:hypothetical protein